MAGRISAPMLRALRLVEMGASVSEAARAAEVDLRALRRALRRAGVPPARAGRKPVMPLKGKK